MGVVGRRDGSMRFGGRKLGHQPVTLTCSLCDHGKIILLPVSVKDDNADVYSIVRTVKEKKIFVTLEVMYSVRTEKLSQVSRRGLIFS